MRPRRLAALCVSALALCFVASATAAAAAAPRWSYSGADGPDRWAALSNAFATCGSGHQQSPIDLTAAAPRDLANPQIAYLPSEARIVDNGHAVEVDFDRAGSILTLDGVPYSLVQLHFHSPSEHTIDGNSFAIELHLVHQAESGAQAVVGVFIAGGSENPALVPLLSALPSKENREVRLRGPFDPSTLLPADLRAYRYTGSLTTPPCSEGVTWLVMATPITASGQQIAALARALEGNNRPVQARGDREILLDSSP
ncbi:MAG TPA: carbonic anhydrase family protein [Thermoanaerobaculia bacterium]|jgi:carbonic anhydrase|nr:carbonic anhydrase family protein [Thermoanaerobaculia bacterium]